MNIIFIHMIQLSTKNITSIRFQANWADQKERMRLWKGIRGPFYGDFMLYSKTDCLSVASYLF
jgi:hypothetical protein